MDLDQPIGERVTVESRLLSLLLKVEIFNMMGERRRAYFEYKKSPISGELPRNELID